MKIRRSVAFNEKDFDVLVHVAKERKISVAELVRLIVVKWITEAGS